MLKSLMRRFSLQFVTPKDAPIEVRFVGNMQRLEIKPGDRFVIQFDGVLSGRQRETMQEQLEYFINSDKTFLVLDSGMKLGVISSYPYQAQE